MAVRPIILRGPGWPKRKWVNQLEVGPSSGSVVPAEYEWGTHAQATHNAEGVKSDIFASVVAAVVITAAIPAFIFAPQQAYADVNQSFVEAPLTAGASPRTIPRLSTVPQVDLTQQGWIAEPQSARQGRVPPITQGEPQDDSSQLAPRLTSAQPAPVTTSPVAPFFSVSYQTEERPTRVVWQAQPAPITVSYAIGQLYAAPQVLDLTQQGWIESTAPVRQSGVPARNWASQDDPSQLAAQVFQSVVTPPIFTGDVPPIVLAGQPQDSTEQIPAITWTPLVFGEPPPPVLDEILIGGDDAPRKKKKRRKSSIEELNDLLDRVVDENAPAAPASAQTLKQVVDAISDQDDDDEEAMIALT